MTHLPFRNWRSHCVRGRRREADHRRAKEEPGGLPEAHVDSMRMGHAEEPGRTLTILVARERKSKMTMATAAPSESTGRFVVERVLAYLKNLASPTRTWRSRVTRGLPRKSLYRMLGDCGLRGAATRPDGPRSSLHRAHQQATASRNAQSNRRKPNAGSTSWRWKKGGGDRRPLMRTSCHGW